MKQNSNFKLKKDVGTKHFNDSKAFGEYSLDFIFIKRLKNRIREEP